MSRRLLDSGERERDFESVGSFCVRCNLDCGDMDAYNKDHHSIGIRARVNENPTDVSLCSHPQTALREGRSDGFYGRSIQNFRICLIKTPDLDPDAKIEY